MALVATLATLIILAILAVIVLSQSPPRPTPVTDASGRPLDTSPTAVASAARAAACQANYDVVASALSTYKSLHGANPPAGTAWATSSAGPLLASWPTGADYTIIWTGRALVVRPAHGPASVNSGGAAALMSGCFALG